jgi:hypothetical protein
MTLQETALMLGACALALISGAKSVAADLPGHYVSEDGTISLPADFRTELSHIGSWFVPSGDASGFHDVFAQADAVRHFREQGEFPDGTVLVKELRASEAGDYTTGKGTHHATPGLKQWFVMIRDRKGRFPDSPQWGDGWGWALFKPENPAVNASGNYRTDCIGCHLPARATDLVYIEGYPALRP